jgi:hypothetical protein
MRLLDLKCPFVPAAWARRDLLCRPVPHAGRRWLSANFTADKFAFVRMAFRCLLLRGETEAGALQRSGGVGDVDGRPFSTAHPDRHASPNRSNERADPLLHIVGHRDQLDTGHRPLASQRWWSLPIREAAASSPTAARPLSTTALICFQRGLARISPSQCLSLSDWLRGRQRPSWLGPLSPSSSWTDDDRCLGGRRS